MAVASLVLGIISLVISVGAGTAGLGWTGSICAILGIIFGVIGKKDSEKKGMAKTGLVLSIIALCWGIVATIACLACFGLAAGASAGLLEGLAF